MQGGKAVHIYRYYLCAYYMLCTILFTCTWPWTLVMGSPLFKKWYLAIGSVNIPRLRFHPRYPDSGRQGEEGRTVYFGKAAWIPKLFCILPTLFLPAQYYQHIWPLFLVIGCPPIKSSLPGSYSLLTPSFKRAANILL